MSKFVIIILLLLVLGYFILKRFNGSFLANKVTYSSPRTNSVEISLPLSIVKKIFSKTITTVCIGVGLLIIILLIASKFKIALIMLPISFYLIGQYFVFVNHISHSRKQKIIYNTESQAIYISIADNAPFVIDFNNNIKIKEIRAVQKNNSIEMGYYQISDSKNELILPFVLKHNQQNITLFNKIIEFDRETETKLFPVI